MPLPAALTPGTPQPAGFFAEGPLPACCQAVFLREAFFEDVYPRLWGEVPELALLPRGEGLREGRAFRISIRPWMTNQSPEDRGPTFV